MINEIQDRLEKMVKKEMTHLRKMGFDGTEIQLRQKAEANVGEAFKKIGLKW